MANDNNKIKLEAYLDTKQVEIQMKQIQEKLQNMQRSGVGGIVGQTTQGGNSQNSERNKRLEDIRKRESEKDRVSILKDLKSQQSALDKQIEKYEKISKLQKNLVEGGKAYERSLEMQNRAFSNMSLNVENIEKIKSNLYGEGMGPFSGRQTEFIKRGFRGGIGRGVGAIGRSIKQLPMTTKLNMLGAGVAATGKAIQAGGEIAFQLGTRDERRTTAESDVAGMLGEASQLQMNRRGYEMQLYAPERQRAMQRAMQRKKFSQIRDVTNTGGSALANVAGFATTGAFLGSVIPGVGTAIGGGIGAGIGLAKTGYDRLTNDTSREGIGSMLGFSDSEDFYEKIKSGEAAKVYGEQLKKEKSISFEKNNAIEYFMKNRDRIQSLQRGFGMSDEDLFLGGDSLYRRGTEAGFMTDTMDRQMQGISSAGGTTAMSKNGAILSAQMERGLNLTNAGQLLGKISGATGMGEEGSKDAIIRMYAEATRLGLDGSEFAKETRTFLDTAASMSYQSGASSQNISGLLGEGLNLYSERGVKASQDALQNLMGKTGQMGGLTGQYQLAGLTSKDMNKFLGKGNEFSESELAMLTSMDVSRVSEDDEYMQSIMRRKGIEDPEKRKEFIDRLKKEKVKSTLRTPEQEKALKEYDELKNSPMTSPEVLADARSKIRELGVIVGGEEEGRRDVLQQKSSADLLSGIMSNKDKDKGILKKTGEMFEKSLALDTGKMTDRAEGAMSFDDKGNLKNLQTYSGLISKSFKDTNDSLVEFRTAMDGLVEAMRNKNVELAKSYEEKLNTLNAAAQSGNKNYITANSESNDIMGDVNNTFNKIFGNSND